MTKTLIRNAMAVFTADANTGELHDADVLVEDDSIVAVGHNLEVDAQTVLDAKYHVVIPGMVNTHHHLYQILTRNLSAVQDAKLFDWLVYLYEIWKHVTPQDVYTAALAGLGELLLSGCTTSADHHYLCPSAVSGDFFGAERQAAQDLGMRLTLTRGSMSLGKKQGGLPPDQVIQSEDDILTDCQRVIEAFHDPHERSMCQVALAPCSPFSVTEDLMRSVAQMARQYGVGLHTHLAETQDEERYCLERFGRRPMQLMEDLNWLGPDVWFAHCVYLNQSEIQHLAVTGTGVAHCPVSNLRLGSGIAPIPTMLDHQVRVGLAVDGSASNDSSNMLRELKTTMLVHRVGSRVDAMPARRALEMACLGGARVLGRNDIGVIAPGLAADIAVFDMRSIAYAGSLHDPIAALLFCGLSDRARWVMVNGRLVVNEHRLVGVDEQLVGQKANLASQSLLRRAGISR